MARESINMLKLRQILRLNNEKKPVRQISELLGLHRKAVTKYIALYEASGFSYKDIASYSDEELHEKLCFGLFYQVRKRSFQGYCAFQIGVWKAEGFGRAV